MKFSIIVPVHNAEHTIFRCVKSLVSQSQELQVIIVENGSSDNSWMVCKQIEKIYDNVEAHQISEQGVSRARNLGISLAVGDIIGFCDSDDYYEKGTIEDVKNIFKKNEVDVVSTRFYSIRENDSNKKKEIGKSKKRDEIISSKKMIEYITCNPFVLGYVWNKFYKSEIINNKAFPDDLDVMEDTFFNVTCFSDDRCIRAYISNKVTYCYCKSERSITESIQRIFDSNGHSRYSNSLYKMLCNKNLSIDEKESIRDQIYRISVELFCNHRNSLNSLELHNLYIDIKTNWKSFIRRVFKFNVLHRLKLAAIGSVIIVLFKKSTRI